ncbi:MAG: tetratricopeptide repeat protein [Gammaproteobacteria bacterium]|nr:tetratricopeptide repeat protein [Gammaproteobacteria bacterium]
MSRFLPPILLALLLAGCGSAGPRPPSAATAPAEALRLGMQFYGDDEFASAEQLFLKALELYRSVDDDAGRLSVLVNLADVALARGEHARALARVAEARQLRPAAIDASLDAHLALLECQALIEARRGPEARPLLDALLARGDLSAPLRQAATIERARLALESSDEPQPWLAQALAALSDGAAPRVRARVLRLQAAAARRAGDAARARELLAQARALYAAEPYRLGIASTLQELAALDVESKDYDSARERYRRALAIRMWLHDRARSAAILELLGALEEAAGKPERADRLRQLRDTLHAPGPAEWPPIQAQIDGLGP